MADIDGTPGLDGAILYATSFKGQTLAIEAPNGRPIWAHDSGGPGRVGMAPDRVLVIDTDGIVWALDKNSGSAKWPQPAVARRSESGRGAGRERWCEEVSSWGVDVQLKKKKNNKH